MSVRRQCGLLGLTRSAVYYRPAETPADDLRLMRLIDEVYTARPFYGSRRMAAELARRGEAVASGYKDAVSLALELDLEPLRADTRYRALLRAVQAEVDAGARQP